MKPGATAQPDASSSRSPAQVRPDLADHAVGDRHVGDPARRAAPVEDRAAADDDVSRHPDLLSTSRRGPCSWLTGGPAAVPPSTGSTIPVICADRSPARYSTAFATSPESPWRWSGCVSWMIAPMS